MPEAVNTALHQWLQDEANVRIHRTTNKRPVDMFEEEKPALQPLPGISQPCCAVDRSVSNSCCRITVGDNYYSIPAAYASSRLILQRGVDRICVRTTEDVFVAEHIRGFARKRPVIDPQHEKQIEDLTSRARHNRQVTLFLQLGSSAFSYLDGREEKRVNYPSHIRRINDVIATFGYDQVARALADTR